MRCEAMKDFQLKYWNLFSYIPEPQEIDDAPEGDNNVQTDEDVNSATVLKKSTANATTSAGFGPQFTNLNSLNRLVMKPSGNMINMRCQAKGDPEPTIEWTKDGKPIERKMGQVQYKKWAITMEDLIPDDSGAYTCKICNKHNCINFTSKLEVNGKCLKWFLKVKVDFS